MSDDSSDSSSQSSKAQRVHGIDPIALLILILGLIAAVLVRLPMLSYDSIDMIGHLKHWYDYIVLNGFFHALADNFADYTPAYLTLIAVMAVLRERWLAAWMSKTTAIKLPSIAFDFALALGVYGILRQLGQSRRRAMFGAVLCLLLPTVAVNSALWGQADGMFTAGVMLAIWLLLAKRPALAAIGWGFALAIKIQVVFIAPVLFYLLLARRMRIWHVALGLIIFALGSLPSILMGRPAIEALTTYISQANLYHFLSFNAPNIWALLPATDYSVGVVTSIVATGLVCVCLLWVMSGDKRHRFLKPVTFDPPSNDVLTWFFLSSALAIPFLLAKMHDRYFFIADVLTLVIACRWPRYFWMPILMQAASLNIYAYVLAGMSFLAWPSVLSAVESSALLNLIVLLAVAWVVVRRAWPNLYRPRLLVGLMGSAALIGAIYFIGVRIGQNNLRPPTLVSNSPGGLSDPGFHPLSIQFGDEVALVGYSMPQPRTYRMSNINVGLYFRPLRKIDTPYLIRLEAFSLDGRSLELTNEAPPQQDVPMAAWLPQQTFIETRFLWVWPETPAPEIATLKVSIVDPISKQALLTTCNGAPCDAKFGVQPIALDYTAVQPWLFAPALANFDPGLQLLHAQINPTPTVTSEGVFYDVEFVWRVSRAPLPQMVNFIHALDQQGELVAQVDSEPNAGRYPTVAWHVGEVVIDHQRITLKQSVMGAVTLVTGWYDRQTQVRAVAKDAAGQGLANEVWRVGEVETSK